MIPVIDRNSNFIVVNKPSGLSFHNKQAESGKNIQGFHTLLKEQLGVDNLYPVHRLDELTSGLVLFALTQNAASELGQLFEQRRIEKLYLALAAGKPKKKQGKIVGDMVPSRRGQWKLTQSKSNPAITQFYSYSIEPNLRLYVIKPKTGKTHQIRVALKSLGVPILGDQRYGGEDASRGCLHAYGLSFTFKEKDYLFYAEPLPLAEFGKVKAAPWQTNDAPNQSAHVGQNAASNWYENDEAVISAFHLFGGG